MEDEFTFTVCADRRAVFDHHVQADGYWESVRVLLAAGADQRNDSLLYADCADRIDKWQAAWTSLKQAFPEGDSYYGTTYETIEETIAPMILPLPSIGAAARVAANA